jgi:hypothetical protein
MPTATRIIDDSVFGPTGGWSLLEHSETIQFRGHTLRLQTSDGQTDDGKRGTFYASLAGPAGRFSTHIPWCPIDEARDLATAWAEKQIPSPDATLKLDVAELAEET